MSKSNISHEIYIFAKTCRLCTSNFEQKNLISLFPNDEQIYNQNQPLVDYIPKYLNLMNFKIEENDGLPNRICRNCYQTFELFHNFVSTCETSNTLLMNYFKLSSENFKEEYISDEYSKTNDYSYDNNDNDIKVEQNLYKNDHDYDNNDNTLNLKEQLDEYEIIETYDDLEIIDDDTNMDDNNSYKNYSTSYIDSINIDKDNNYLLCELCKSNDIKFMCNNNLIEHKEKYHPIDCPYLCMKCFRNFRTEKILLKHIALDICTENLNKLIEMKDLCKTNLMFIDDNSNDDSNNNNNDDDSNNNNNDDDVDLFIHTFKNNKLVKKDRNYCNIPKKSKKITCTECLEVFNDIRKLKVHFKTVHPEIEENIVTTMSRHLCEICGKDLKEQSLLEDHIYMHKGVKPYKCNYCDEAFHSRKTFAMHTRDHAEGPFECKICNREFQKKKTYACHLKWHEKQNQPDERHKCPFCTRYFTTLSTLTLHAARHRKPTETKHICPECKAPFKRADHLKMHIDGVHLKKTPYACNQCPKSFVTMWQKNIHVKQFHSERKMLKCSYCEKQYNSINSIRRHEKIHTGEMIYQCEICTIKFVSIPLLRVHLKTHKVDETEKQNIISETYEQLTNAVFGD